MRGMTLVFAIFLAVSASAEPYRVGASLAPLSLQDQHDEEQRLDASVQVVLFSRDMAGGDLLEAALEESPKGWLPQHHVLYVADIHGMPALIARMFAIPSMRKRPYPMLLDRDGEATARFPSEEGKATLLFLEDLRIQRLFFASSSAEIRRALGLPSETKDD